MMVRKVTLLGHKDHGKSTLIGNLLILTGSATEYRINEAKKTSEKLGRPFEPGFILDSFEEEREGGLTIDTTRAQIKYGDYAFEFIDVPGHEELTKNMISGASYADVAMLMVSVKKEEGIKQQTRRHLFIAKMLGITRIVVAVNKMDLVGYDFNVFDGVKKELSTYLEKIGFDRKNVTFVPVSAYGGENLVKKSGKIKWYGGACLVDALVEMSSPEVKKGGEPLVVLQGFISPERDTIAGVVLSGKVSKGEILKILPKEETMKIVDIFIRGKKSPSASTGSNVALRLEKPLGYEVRGMVLVENSPAKKAVNKVHALVFAVRRISKNPEILINGVRTACTDVKVDRVVDIATGDDSASKVIRPLGAAYLDFTLQNKIVARPFEQTPGIGRFVIYDGGKFAGIGIVV